MYKTTISLILLAVSTAFNATAQSGSMRPEELKTVIPPSPTAAALGKYADWPVSLYTGTPGISIPLYTVSGRDFSVPVTVSYHASGIRVSEVASWVGLGWSLNAGGVITRSVKGLPDEASGTIGYFAFRQQFSNPGNPASGTGNITTDNWLKIDAADGKVDTEPDIYTLNAAGNNYKLLFKGDGSIVTIPYSKIKITADWSTNTWHIVLEDGTKLLFGQSAVETVSANRSWPTEVPRDPFVTAWYLKQLTTVAGETVSFSYTPYILHQNNTFYETDYFKNNTAPGGVVPCAINQPCVINGVENRKTHHLLQQGEGLNLSAIESSDCRIEFIVNNGERQDMQHGKSLAAIKVFAKATNTCIKTFVFNHTYTTAAPGNDYGATAYHKKRLRLLSIEEQGSDLTTVKTWEFGYNGTSLPAVKSFAQDHWGYYNGAVTNKTLLPQLFTNKYVVQRGFNPLTTPIGNREPNAAFIQAEMLNKITYPTGGWSQFEYEPNSYPTQEEQFAPQQITQQLLLTPLINPFLNSKTNSFTTTNEQYVSYQLSGTFSAAYQGEAGNLSVLARCKIRNSSGVEMSSLGLKKTDLNYDGYAQKQTTVYLPPGSYTIELSSPIIQPEMEPNQQATVNTTFSYAASQGIQAINKPSGGLRIKKMTAYDAATDKTIEKTYTYEQPFVITPFVPVDFYLSEQEKELDRHYSDVPGDPCQVLASYPSSDCYQKYLVRSNSSKCELGSIQGSTTGYGKVTTLYGTGGINGYTVSEFLNVPDNNVQNSLEFPFTQANSVDWQRGQLLKETNYRADNVPLDKTENTYELLPQPPSVYSYKAGWRRIKFRAPLISVSVGDLLGNLQVRDIYLSSGLIRPASTTKTGYENGVAVMTNTVNYYYDNIDNLRATRTETANSNGELITTITRSPLEKAAINTTTPLTAAASTAIDSLLARNIITPVLQTETWKGGTLLERSLVNYKQWTTHLLLPETVQLQKNGTAMLTKLHLNAYDDKGNLLEQQLPDNVVQCYVWGYNKMYPVAQVVGASYATVSSFINQAVLDNPLSTTAQVRAELQKIRTGLAATTALVTSFTYTPLLGVTSQTDANNNTIFYEYDAFGRLKTVRDTEGNLVKKLAYGYKQSF
jgi:YD repeat-containing protein